MCACVFVKEGVCVCEGGVCVFVKGGGGCEWEVCVCEGCVCL